MTMCRQASGCRSGVSHCRARVAFSLVEVLVAATVLILLLGILLSVTDHTTRTVRNASAMIDAFAEARGAFDSLSKQLSTSTLNTFWDYDNSTAPTRYMRKSSLQLLVQQNTQYGGQGQELYFQSPAAYSANLSYQSASGLLNACGFFVRYGNDDKFRPATMNSPRWRYRLMQWLQPTESFQVYQSVSLGNHDWINSAEADALPIADNIIALVIWPQLPVTDDATGTKLTANYLYDSTGQATANPQPITANQLPPIVRVTLITIDEATAIRIDTHSSAAPPALVAALKDRFTDVSKYSQDLAELTAILAASHINYQILNTSVALRESKWSQ